MRLDDRSGDVAVDATSAGSGNLEIMINGGEVGCSVREDGGPRSYVASFVPVQPVVHLIEMRFNGDPIKGSPINSFHTLVPHWYTTFISSLNYAVFSPRLFYGPKGGLGMGRDLEMGDNTDFEATRM